MRDLHLPPLHQMIIARYDCSQRIKSHVYIDIDNKTVQVPCQLSKNKC